MMSLRSAYVLVATVLLSLACAQAGAAPPALPVRNGDVLYSKQLMKPDARAADLYANWFADGYAKRLTRTPKSHELDPAASPNGRLIAYTRISLARPGSQIWAVRKDGSHRRFIARGSEPAWSPDGKRIVFVGPRQPRVSKPEIYIMRADGTHIRRLTNNWNASDRSPSFSPDGKRIVFLSNRDATGGAGNPRSGSWTPMASTPSTSRAARTSTTTPPGRRTAAGSCSSAPGITTRASRST